MHFLYQPYVKRSGALLLLLAWLLVFGVKALHVHPHTSADTINVHHTSNAVLLVTEKDHHHCVICEYQVLGDAAISFPSIAEPVILLNAAFGSFYEHNLSHRDSHLTTSRGPPVMG